MYVIIGLAILITAYEVKEIICTRINEGKNQIVKRILEKS